MARAPGGRNSHVILASTDGATREDCIKLVTHFNKEVALYCTLALGLGGTSDSEKLREETKRCRTRACDLAHQIKLKLLPLLRSKMRRQEDNTGLEHLCRLYSGCLEILQLELMKTASLQRTFPLHSVSGILVLINTGITEPVVGCKMCGTADYADNSTVVNSAVLETQELLRIESAAQDVQELVFAVSQMVDVQPWDADPVTTSTYTKAGEDCSSISTGSTTAMQPMVISIRSRRKCLVLVLVLVLLIIIGSSLVGLLAGVLKW